MINNSDSLTVVLDGWNGYQKSLVSAVKPLTPEQLAWRPAAKLNSVEELVRHISLGRITWFRRMHAPGSAEISSQVKHWGQDTDGNQYIDEKKIEIAGQASALVHWLELSWQIIDQTLTTWKIADLSQSYRHVWNGTAYAVTRQWTIWRILSHDIHHGGELSLMLGMQGIEAFELSGLFGHIILPPLWHEDQALPESLMK
ncbi:MAG: DinB family protein [Anaerolineales bacterium]